MMVFSQFPTKEGKIVIRQKPFIKINKTTNKRIEVARNEISVSESRKY